MVFSEDDRNAANYEGQQKPIKYAGPRVKPNGPCYCGSGKKFKKYHGAGA